MIEEHPQQPVLGAAEGDHGAVAIEQVSGGSVQAPTTEGQQAAGFGHHQVRRQHACAAQHGVDACQQFAGGEGLDQVVIGAHFQADDTVGFIVARGEHQYRGGLVFARAQLAAEHQAIVAGHHDI
ncbi:hypothetical protein D3C80_1743750 [compost metagenome]